MGGAADGPDGGRAAAGVPQILEIGRCHEDGQDLRFRVDELVADVFHIDGVVIHIAQGVVGDVLFGALVIPQ